MDFSEQVDRFWWITASGAYGMHGEMLYECPYWSNSHGTFCGESVGKIAWFKEFMENTTLHPPFDDCVGGDDGYVHTLTCGTDFLLFHFYGTHPNASSSFRYINLPKLKGKMRQDLLQPWEMIITTIWEPPPASCSGGECAEPPAVSAPPPPGVHIFGPKRDPATWEPTGISKPASNPSSLVLSTFEGPF